MFALELAYHQSVFRVVPLGVCSTSEKQVIGIAVQWDSQFVDKLFPHTAIR